MIVRNALWMAALRNANREFTPIGYREIPSHQIA